MSSSASSLPIAKKLGYDNLNSAFSFLSLEDRRLVVPLVCKTFKQALSDDPAGLIEDRAYTLFRHPSQQSIVRLFGAETITNSPVVPFDKRNQQAAFNAMKQQGTRIAVGRTQDNSWSKHGIVILFQTYEAAEEFYSTLFEIDLNAPPRIPTQEECRQAKEKKMKAVAEIIGTSSNPIVVAPQRPGILFFKNRRELCLAPVNH